VMASTPKKENSDLFRCGVELGAAAFTCRLVGQRRLVFAPRAADSEIRYGRRNRFEWQRLGHRTAINGFLRHTKDYAGGFVLSDGVANPSPYFAGRVLSFALSALPPAEKC
jgi:hypothetical protein